MATVREDLEVRIKADETELAKALKRFDYLTGNAFAKSASETIGRAEQTIAGAAAAGFDKKRYGDTSRALATAAQLEEYTAYQKIRDLIAKKNELATKVISMQWDKAVKDLRSSIFNVFTTTGGIALTMAQPIKAAATFEASLINVAKVYRMSTEETQAFGKTLIELTKVMPVTYQEVGKLAYEMAQLGFSRVQLPEAIKLAVMTGTSLDMPLTQVGEALGTLKGAFNLKSITEIEKVLDFVNEASNIISKKPKEILEATTRMGSLAGSLNLTPRQATSLAATLLNVGWMPENTETGIKDLLSGLSSLYPRGGGTAGGAKGSSGQ